MPRTSFLYKGTNVSLYATEDGWRYYQSADETLKIKCKGLNVEIV